VGRLWRILLNALTVGSLLCCFGAVVFWVRSYRGSSPLISAIVSREPVDHIRYVGVDSGIWLEASSHRGRVYLLRFCNFEITDHGPATSADAAGDGLVHPFDFAARGYRYSLAWRGGRHGSIALGEKSGSLFLESRMGGREADYDLGVARWERGHLPTPFWNKTGPPRPDPPPLSMEELPRFWLLTVPHGSVAGLFAVLPAARAGAVLRGWRRSRGRLLAGLCRSCGYDLRATPERCPECGAVSSGAASADGRRA
jgi:hypothetical protein